MIPVNDRKAVARKALEMYGQAEPAVRKLMDDPEIMQKFAVMIEGLERYKDYFVQEYRLSLERHDPDWKNKKDPSESVRKADEEAQQSMQCSPQMLALLLKAAHKELGIVLGLRVGHYRIKEPDYKPVTDDILEEMMYVGMREVTEQDRKKKEG